MIGLDRRALLAASGASLLAFGPARGAPRAIDEQGFVRIGGIDQWIAIRGRDVANPVIVYLHGGPGEAQSPFLTQFLPWEQDYTVVNWDQRGSGRTYGRYGHSTPAMTLDQLAADAVEVVEHACRRLGASKVILVGQSWGGILGLNVIKRKPPLFHAYVGTGQPVNWALDVKDQERWARDQATTLGDAETLKALNDTAGLAPDDRRRMNASRKYRMSPPDLEYTKILGAFIGPPPPPKTGEVADWLAGYDFSSQTIGSLVQTFDVRTLGMDYPMPVFVVQGRDDHIMSAPVAEAWLAEVRAPAKAFVAIAGGHYACFTNPPSFLGALRDHVLPVVHRA